MSRAKKPAKPSGFFVTPPPIPQPTRLRRFVDNVVGVLFFFALAAVFAFIITVLRP